MIIRKFWKIPLGKDKKLLSEEQKRKRAKYIVYPLFFLLFVCSLFLIYSPSDGDMKEGLGSKGFNTEIPSPENKRLLGNKVDAYQSEELAEKEKKRRGRFQEMASLFDREKQDTVKLPDGTVNTVEKEVKTGYTDNTNSSMYAYRNVSRTMKHIYTSPSSNLEKESLLKRIEELEARQAEPVSGNSMQEKMALMEKSYELAAKYNGKQPINNTTSVSKADKKKAMPIKRIQEQVVSSLSYPMTDQELVKAFSGECNSGFNTPVGRQIITEGNTIAACVHGTQTVSDGQALRIRLAEPMFVADRFIPKGTVLVGSTRMQGERMNIAINAVEYKGSIFPVDLIVCDMDGQEGILIPNSLEYDAVREIAANMGTSMNSSINISTDAGAQIASDLGKGVIQGVSQYISKKMHTVKITLKAGHNVLLYSPEK